MFSRAIKVCIRVSGGISSAPLISHSHRGLKPECLDTGWFTAPVVLHFQLPCMEALTQAPLVAPELYEFSKMCSDGQCISASGILSSASDMGDDLSLNCMFIQLGMSSYSRRFAFFEWRGQQWSEGCVVCYPALTAVWHLTANEQHHVSNEFKLPKLLQPFPTHFLWISILLSSIETEIFIWSAKWSKYKNGTKGPSMTRIHNFIKPITEPSEGRFQPLFLTHLVSSLIISSSHNMQLWNLLKSSSETPHSCHRRLHLRRLWSLLPFLGSQFSCAVTPLIQKQ